MSPRHKGQMRALDRALLAFQFLPASSSAVRKGVQTISESCGCVIDVARAEGYAPICPHYNSCRHISINGGEFVNLHEQLWLAWRQPVDELSVVAHSMGGLLHCFSCQ